MIGAFNSDCTDPKKPERSTKLHCNHYTDTWTCLTSLADKHLIADAHQVQVSVVQRAMSFGGVLGHGN